MASAAVLAGESAPQGIPIGGDAGDTALRFEDLTIDDDLPLLERVVRYCRSGIALQRLVHVKMLAETAETVGMNATLSTLVPLLHPLVFDPESIIRQHLASQLLPLSIVCMVRGMSPDKSEWPSVEEIRNNPSTPRLFVEAGYKVVTSSIVSHLHALIMDVDMDVRRAASESLAGLAPQLRQDDVGTVIVPIPVALSQEMTITPQNKNNNYPESFPEELRMTSSHLLAELAGAAELDGEVPSETVVQQIWPAVCKLCQDKSFKVRRSAAQALPRVLGGTSHLGLAKSSILPMFQNLASDDMYRVRKSTGECLVDMSRSLMLLGQNGEDVNILKELRREILIPIALQLLNDSNKVVRHGMMQFLGPFIASFYPLDKGHLPSLLPTADGTSSIQIEGIGSQFFPHASSMVSRLNASGNTTSSSPTPTPATLDPPSKTMTERQLLDRSLPDFIVSNRVADLTLHAVVAHCQANPPDPEDIATITTHLMPHFCGLSTIDTGDDNIDAEMRVYCAYSYPAVVLLMGVNGWKQGHLRQCFFNLVSCNSDSSTPPPLPVKRCLASSLHTVAHVLGPELFQKDMLSVFFEHFYADTDDSVRLNVLTHFPHLLQLQSPEKRSELLGKWKELVEGQDLLGARKRRSATNPMLLNWRQRDAVSKSLPELLSSSLVSPTQVHKYVWPVLLALLQDSVSQVREDAEWSVPLVLRSVSSDLVMNSGTEAKRWSAQVCQEIMSWLKEAILGQGANNFGHRQLYCRICAALGLALRFGDLDQHDQWDAPYQLLQPSAPSRRFGGSSAKSMSYVAYQTMSPSERKHLRRLLVYDLLPPSLEFKTDRVTNVRLTLMKALQEMPKDIQSLASVSEVLKELQEEVETWESFNAGGPPPPPPPPPRNQQASV